MNSHVNEFFRSFSGKSPKGNFYKVIDLHSSPDVDWKSLQAIAPSLPRGWYELCQLSKEDRIQFTFEYWQSKLIYQPQVAESIASFFSQVNDVGVFLTQAQADSAFDAQMVYSLVDDRGFYRGYAPAKEDEIINLQKLFPSYILPQDYRVFLLIHDGFCKATDCTGVIRSGNLENRYREFLELIARLGPIKTEKGTFVDPKALIPFYESFGMPYYQCFWGEWYPEQEMGNVYYSSDSHTISEVDPSKPLNPERMTFPTFIDWLFFYLEQIEF